MAEHVPAKRTKALAIQRATELAEDFAEIGITNWETKHKNGKTTLVARNENGDVFRIEDYSGSSYMERTISQCQKLTPPERKSEAKRLRKQGLTQSEIADRLGCSQKTISNDLNS